MGGLRLLADDLTGALDAAAPFAAARGAIGVTWWGGESLGGEGAAWAEGDGAVSSASRDLCPEAAAGRVRHLAPGLATGAPAFKKIDSLLRGNTAAEIVAAHLAGGFAATIVCPAFPAQGRIVRGGRVITPPDPTGTAGEIDLAAMLREAGARSGIVVHDAESDADLEALADAHRHDGALLWAGSSGLARALSGRVTPLVVPPARPLLVVTASRHPLTRRQLASFGGAFPGTLLRDDGMLDPARLGHLAGARIGRGAATVLDASPPTVMAAAGARMARCFGALAEAAAPALLAVIGGDTLAHLLAALGCRRLLVQGEVSAGLPLAVLADGRWGGTPLISRSGAFDDGGTIARALGAAA